MNLIQKPPIRAFIWPDLVYSLQSAVSTPERLYLVGGVVRDALRGSSVHDIDLTTPLDGLSIAREIANAMGGDYYPVDQQRGTGRAILTLDSHDNPVHVDVATFRGTALEDDLIGRDFTINAMAVPLDDLKQIIDPLGGQQDLLAKKVLNMCSKDSISSDPIRALRALRMGLQFNLRLHPATTSAVRGAASALRADSDTLQQPERVRDELFKGFQKTNAASLLRLYQAVGVYQHVNPAGSILTQAQLGLFQTFYNLLTIISPRRDDNIANELFLGVAVMVLDRYRGDLQAYLSEQLTDDRTVEALLLIAVLVTFGTKDVNAWADYLKLSKVEKLLLRRFIRAAAFQFPSERPLSDRTLFHYYRAANQAGIGGALFVLAQFLGLAEADAKTWGHLLEGVADPIIKAYLQRYDVIVAPVPLLDGTDLMSTFSIEPGPIIGDILRQLIEAQAVGEITDYDAAVEFVRSVIANE